MVVKYSYLRGALVTVWMPFQRTGSVSENGNPGRCHITQGITVRLCGEQTIYRVTKKQGRGTVRELTHF